MTKFRLGWETQLDQLTLAIDLALLGVGLILTGALVPWHGWLAHTLGILLIVIGAILCLVDGLRLLGWRSLLWPRTLLLDAQGISDDTKKGPGFRINWSELKALGVIDDPARPGLMLVFFTRSRSDDSRLTPYAGFAPPDWPQPVAATVPRRTGLVEAVLAGKPAEWNQQRADGWAAVITAPGERADAIPVPPAAEPQQRIDVGTQIAWQAIVGGALAGLLGVLAYLAAFGVLASTASRTAFLVVGTPFLLIGLATLLSIPVVVRRRWVVIDRETFTWADPTETSFTLAWSELASVSIEIATVVSATVNRHSVHVELVPADADRHPELKAFAKDGRYVLRLGDVVGPAHAIANACQRVAPAGVWQGVAERAGTLGIS
ncbi:hypothetical protein [Kribbella sp.]|uniref:hypothetical protein n=1 Tax=Kribbella sp. TaxID=1871183 RepID=UPI002D534B78|nr:hypothetical protein [Kribbella sp.]HZX02031.1 hypothetical protein [Kribbella sp.]